MATFVLIGRLLVGGVFIASGVIKLKLPSSSFLASVLGYDLVPIEWAAVLARSLPWIEVGVGSMLLLGVREQEATLAGFAMLMAFTIAIEISLLRGKKQDCGCFGSRSVVQWRLAYRNLLLMALLVLAYAHSGAIGTGPELAYVKSNWSPNVHQSMRIAIEGGWFIAVVSTAILHWLKRQAPEELRS